MTRVEADLIHMGILEGEVYRYVCHAHDHFTKCSWAAPLKTKEANEVAQVIRDLMNDWLP